MRRMAGRMTTAACEVAAPLAAGSPHSPHSPHSPRRRQLVTLRARIKHRSFSQQRQLYGRGWRLQPAVRIAVLLPPPTPPRPPLAWRHGDPSSRCGILTPPCAACARLVWSRLAPYLPIYLPKPYVCRAPRRRGVSLLSRSPPGLRRRLPPPSPSRLSSARTRGRAAPGPESVRDTATPPPATRIRQ